MNEIVRKIESEIKVADAPTRDAIIFGYLDEIANVISPVAKLTPDGLVNLVEKMLLPEFDRDIKNLIKTQYPHIEYIAEQITELFETYGISHAPDSVLAFTKITCLQLFKLYNTYITDVEALIQKTLKTPMNDKEKLAQLAIATNQLRQTSLPDKLMIVDLASTFFGEDEISVDAQLQNMICAAFYTHTDENIFEDIVNGWSLGAKNSDITRVIDIKTNDRNGFAIATSLVEPNNHVMLITNTGRIIITPANTISLIGRNTMGVSLISLVENEKQITVDGNAHWADSV
jgi:DNA gyrase/topoisomerase IV subunit A